MKKKVIMLLMFSVMLCGCNKKEDVSNKPSEVVESVEESGSEEKVESTPEPTVEPTAEPTSEPIAEPTTESSVEPTEEPIKGAEERENLVNTYADIDLSPYEDYISFDDYSWFKLPEDMFEWDYPTYMSIVCAINEYYGGNVEGTYTCDINTDIVSMETNMVWQIKVSGSENNLLVGINGYENTASVEEVPEWVEGPIEYGVEYVNKETGEIFIAFDPNPDISTEHIRDSFSEVIGTISEYKVFNVSDYDYYSEDNIAKSPEWVRNNYIFYPDEWENLFCFAVSVDMFGENVVFEEAESYSYYHYNGSDYEMCYKVNGTDMCFVFCEDASVVYVYDLALETRE